MLTSSYPNTDLIKYQLEVASCKEFLVVAQFLVENEKADIWGEFIAPCIKKCYLGAVGFKEISVRSILIAAANAQPMQTS